MTDASDMAVGAVLQQTLTAHSFSRKMTPAETRYSSELLALYLAIKQFRDFLEG